MRHTRRNDKRVPTIEMSFQLNIQFFLNRGYNQFLAENFDEKKKNYSKICNRQVMKPDGLKSLPSI